jgi:uncharacterized membrane protein
MRQRIIDRHWLSISCAVASKSLVKRITAALAALNAADKPISQLEAARQLREAADELEIAQVMACYGLSKQGAQQRFRAIRDQPAGGQPG